MTKEQVIELFRKIKYPGFSRDIVSFGIIKDIHIVERNITIDIQISTSDKDIKQGIITQIRNQLQETGAFDNVEINNLEVSQPPLSQTAKSTVSAPMPLQGVKYVIAVASGKGGVGKSTVAVNVAASLARSGYKVGLLDLDIYGPSLPILLGINEKPTLTENNKLIPLEKYGMKVMSFGFLSGNDTPVIWRGPMVARMTEQFFQDVIWGDLDYLILDLPPGTGDVQLTLVQKVQISGAVIVTTPQDLALADVRKGADMFRKVNAPVLGVVENMSGYQLSGVVYDDNGNPFHNATVSLSGLDQKTDSKTNDDGEFCVNISLFKKGGGVQESTRLNVPLLGEIPIVSNIMEACDNGIPIIISDPDCSISQTFSKIAENIRNVVEAKQ